MRYVKLAVGALLLLLAIWVVVGEQLAGASADATINAPIVTLRSPVQGTVDMPQRQIGSNVAASDVIASVGDTAPVTTRLNDLEMEQAKAKAHLTMLQAQADATRAALERMKDMMDARQGSHPANGAPATAPTGTDTPYPLRQTEQLTETADDIAAGIEEGKADLSAIEQRIKTERQSLGKQSNARVTAGVDGLYWQALAHDGTYVNRGDPIARMVDCKDELVTASVSEGTYQSLSRGMSVRFRASGQRRMFQGVIVRLAGAGAATANENMAIAPSAKHLQRYDIAVTVPGLAQDPSLHCAIGRTGRVFTGARPLDWLRGLF